MAYKITDACIACGACQANCPCDAINEGEIYVIDADKCIGCGICAKNCPVNAITRTDYIAPGHKLASFTIDTSLCVKCGVCMGNCRPKAITKG